MKEEDAEEAPTLLKILLAGYTRQKSLFLLSAAGESLTNTFISTIGIDFKIVTIEHNQKMYKLQMWDTSCQERFNSITSSYFRGAAGVFICFDPNDTPDFLGEVKDWKTRISYYEDDQHRFGKVILSMTDSSSHPPIQSVSDFALSENIPFVETRPKDYINVEESLHTMIDQINTLKQGITKVSENVPQYEKQTGACVLL